MPSDVHIQFWGSRQEEHGGDQVNAVERNAVLPPLLPRNEYGDRLFFPRKTISSKTHSSRKYNHQYYMQ